MKVEYRHIIGSQAVYGYMEAIKHKIKKPCSLILKRAKRGKIIALSVAKIDNSTVGLSFCSSKDKFSKKKGRQISLARCLGLRDYYFIDNNKK